MSDLEDVLSGTTAKEIAWSVSAAVREGRLVDGAKLPPIRTAAAQLSVAPATVSAAWALLARAGLIRTDGRRGTSVRSSAATGPRRYRRALERESGLRLDLSTGVPDPDLLPDLRAALRRVGGVGGTSSYLDDPTLPALVEVLRADWPCPADAFTVLDGAMDAMDHISRAFLRFGDVVAVEQPAFPPLLDLLDAAGVQLIGVQTDEHGPTVDGLRAALGSGARALFYQPRVQNPTGASLAPDRATGLADMLEPHPDVLIVEDDSAGPLAATDAISLGQRLPEQTLHIRSFSKSCGPDLRLAAIGGPGSLLQRLTDLRFLGQGWSSRLLQAVLVDLLTHAESRGQIARARAEYSRRTTTLARSLQAAGLEVRAAEGLNLWVPVADETAALLHLAGHGIGAAAGNAFWLDAAPSPFIRVTAGLIRHDLDTVAAVLTRAAVGVGMSGPG